MPNNIIYMFRNKGLFINYEGKILVSIHIYSTDEASKTGVILLTAPPGGDGQDRSNRDKKRPNTRGPLPQPLPKNSVHQLLLSLTK